MQQSVYGAIWRASNDAAVHPVLRKGVDPQDRTAGDIADSEFRIDNSSVHTIGPLFISSNAHKDSLSNQLEIIFYSLLHLISCPKQK